jgi:hypothetical protein
MQLTIYYFQIFSARTNINARNAGSSTKVFVKKIATLKE